MPKTKPFAELAAEAKADPVRRARIEAEKQAMRETLKLAEPRARREADHQESDDEDDQEH